jgi:hypothetical protein
VRKPARSVSALYHLNHAIRALLVENPPIEVFLMTALLLQLLETLNHNAPVALIHLRSALKILEDFKQRVSRGDVVNSAQTEFVLEQIQPVVELAAIYAEVTLQPAINSNTELVEQHSEEMYVLREKTTRPGLVDSFRGMVDARNNLGGQAVQLTQAMARGVSFSDRDHRGQKSTQLHQLREDDFIAARNRLEHCKRLFKPIHEEKSSNTTIRMLSIHLKIIEMLMQDWRPSSLQTPAQLANPPIPDPFAEKSSYDLLLSELHALLTATPLQLYEDFKIEIGLLPPLFYLATSPRQDIPISTRTQAIDLMERYLSERKEGVWSGAIASRLAREIVEMRKECEGRGWEVLNGLSFEVCSTREREGEGEAEGKLWIVYRINPLSEDDELGTRNRESKSQLRRWKCTSWSREEIALLPRNINEVVRNIGYQGYFADAVAAAKSAAS